jgi:hypothetical protein
VPSPAAPPLYASEAADASSGQLATQLLPTVCPACRQGNIGMLYLLPYGDSDPSHYSEDFGPTSTLSFFRNGRLAVTSAAVPGGQLTPFAFGLPMLPGKAVYRLQWSQSVLNDPALSADTDWTFRSSPGGPGPRHAALERCSPDPARGCSFLPLLFINYNLALDSLSRAKADEPFRIAFTVSSQQGQAAPRGLSATVSVSYNGGKTWTAPQTAAGRPGGRFSVMIHQPPLTATDGFVSLRVTARDQAGNSVTQTITRAYGLSG